MVQKFVLAGLPSVAYPLEVARPVQLPENALHLDFVLKPSAAARLHSSRANRMPPEGAQTLVHVAAAQSRLLPCSRRWLDPRSLGVIVQLEPEHAHRLETVVQLSG